VYFEYKASVYKLNIISNTSKSSKVKLVNLYSIGNVYMLALTQWYIYIYCRRIKAMLHTTRVSFRGASAPLHKLLPPSKFLAMVYIKVPQNAPEAIYKSVKCKNFLEQHSQVQVPESAPETI